MCRPTTRRSCQRQALVGESGWGSEYLLPGDVENDDLGATPMSREVAARHAGSQATSAGISTSLATTMLGCCNAQVWWEEHHRRVRSFLRPSLPPSFIFYNAPPPAPCSDIPKLLTVLRNVCHMSPFYISPKSFISPGHHPNQHHRHLCLGSSSTRLSAHVQVQLLHPTHPHPAESCAPPGPYTEPWNWCSL